ncbi:MAG: Ig domain-containing protein, partial [Gemmataceae bacterium]|nr:Ig domain-containing protein [Gemmataceae bacterium]
MLLPLGDWLRLFRSRPKKARRVDSTARRFRPAVETLEIRELLSVAPLAAAIVPPPENQPPALTNPGNQSSAEGAIIDLPIQTSDCDGDPVAVSATGLPPGLIAAEGGITGTIDFTAAEASGGIYTVILNASDGRGGATSATFSWIVADTNRPPLLGNPGPRSTAEGTAVSLQLLAGDPDG